MSSLFVKESYKVFLYSRPKVCGIIEVAFAACFHSPTADVVDMELLLRCCAG